MTEHVETNLSGDEANEPATPAQQGGRRLTMALAAAVALTVAGGWAYDNRDQYAAAYADLTGAKKSCAKSDFAVGGCATSLAGGCASALSAEGCPSALTAGNCCHDSGEEAGFASFASRMPVEAPKPAVAVSEGESPAIETRDAAAL